jgi:hypothetical protein
MYRVIINDYPIAVGIENAQILNVPPIQGGPTLTIFAITRFLIIEKILRLAKKRHTLWSYKPIPLFYLLSIGLRVKRR